MEDLISFLIVAKNKLIRGTKRFENVGYAYTFKTEGTLENFT